MKQAVLFVFFSATLLSTSGCRGKKVSLDSPAEKHNPVEVVITGEGGFPEFMAGRWKAKGTSGWEIVFENDGSVSSAVVAMGVEMFPGRDTTFETVGGGQGIFKPGEWLVEYNAQSRELAVTIEIESFYQDVGENSVMGSSTDVFKGPVDEEKLQWQAEWYSFPNYVINIGDKQHELPVDANDNPHRILTFKKVRPKE